MPAVLERHTDERQGRAVGQFLSTSPATVSRLPQEESGSISPSGRFITVLVYIATTLCVRIADLARRRGNTHTWELIKAVEEMKQLDRNWNGYDSEPPHPLAREIAKDILLKSASVVVPAEVMPSAEGGIGICFYSDERYADIECLNTGRILATISDGQHRPEVWQVKPIEIGPALERIHTFLKHG